LFGIEALTRGDGAQEAVVGGHCFGTTWTARVQSSEGGGVGGACAAGESVFTRRL